MRIQTKGFALAAACLCLTVGGLGCGNTNVNETPSTGSKGATGATNYKDGGAPPKTIKEFYEREQKARGGVSANKSAVAPKPAEAPKPPDTPKP
jgi:hypothetical protein